MIYDLKVKKTDGTYMSLNDYKGKVMIIVNTATKCGFAYQYKELEEIYKKYKDLGLVILSFPSNQFNNQEPLNDSEITEFCTINHNVTFDTFAKIDVNGQNADPLFKYLKKQTKGLFGSSIKWNFTKFLIDKNGKLIKRYGPNISPYKLEKDLELLLK